MIQIPPSRKQGRNYLFCTECPSWTSSRTWLESEVEFSAGWINALSIPQRPFSAEFSFRSPGERNGNPLQYSSLENSMDRASWWITVHGVARSQAWLSSKHFQTFTWWGLRDVSELPFKNQRFPFAPKEIKFYFLGTWKQQSGGKDWIHVRMAFLRLDCWDKLGVEWECISYLRSTNDKSLRFHHFQDMVIFCFPGRY